MLVVCSLVAQQKTLSVAERFPSREDIYAPWLFTSDRAAGCVMDSLANHPAAPAQTTREMKLFSHNTPESSRHHERLAEPPTALILSAETPFLALIFLPLLSLSLLIIIASHACWSCSLKRSNPADVNELEAADSRGCSAADTALLDKNSIFSKSDMGQANYTLWYLWVACTCAVSHAQAHAWALDRLGLRSPFKLRYFKAWWWKWFIVGERWLPLFASVDPL